ncbi:MAG: phosphoadenosine phosphosulfate reductase family protein [Bacteroidota bacterium]
MKKILSYGGGVNSTAILAMVELGMYEKPDEIIFCDTGVERQETYCYLKFIKKYFDIITIQSDRGTLLEYCNKYKIIPARMTRWCTIEFKIKPFDKYLKGVDHIKILGIDAGEKHRVRADSKNIEYPLIENNIDRAGCIELIKKVGWDVPKKSGCYICPFMRIKELHELRKYNPKEFKILVDIEKQANERNNKIYFKNNMLIENYCNDLQTEIEFDEPIEDEMMLHCLCKYE